MGKESEGKNEETGEGGVAEGEVKEQEEEIYDRKEGTIE